MSFTTVTIPRLYRISRTTNPVELPSWEYAKDDGTFGNRWDDRAGKYRVLYTSSSIDGALVETFQDFRPDLALQAQLDTIERDDEELDELDRHHGLTGVVPLDFFANRYVGTIDFHPGTAVNVVGVDSIQEIRARLAGVAHNLGLDDISAATMLGTIPKALDENRRVLTQTISRYIYDRPHQFAAIACPSALGTDFINYTVFENLDAQGVDRLRLSVQHLEVTALSPDMPEVRTALERLHLTLEGEKPGESRKLPENPGAESTTGR